MNRLLIPQFTYVHQHSRITFKSTLAQMISCTAHRYVSWWPPTTPAHIRTHKRFRVSVTVCPLTFDPTSERGEAVLLAGLGFGVSRGTGGQPHCYNEANRYIVSARFSIRSSFRK